MGGARRLVGGLGNACGCKIGGCAKIVASGNGASQGSLDAQELTRGEHTWTGIVVHEVFDIIGPRTIWVAGAKVSIANEVDGANGIWGIGYAIIYAAVAWQARFVRVSPWVGKIEVVANFVCDGGRVGILRGTDIANKDVARNDALKIGPDGARIVGIGSYPSCGEAFDRPDVKIFIRRPAREAFHIIATADGEGALDADDTIGTIALRVFAS